MHILIVEDEAIIAQRLKRLLKAILLDRWETLESLPSLDLARDYLEKVPVDLLFLDLNLKGNNGFDLLKEATAGTFQTIIVSAYTDQAIHAFEYGVLDFVGKPFNQDRLEKAVARYEASQSHSKTRYLSVKKAHDYEIVALESLSYIRGAGPYSELVLRDGRVLLHTKTLDKLYKQLPENWQRIHKSYLVDMKRISKFQVSVGTKYSLVLNDGTQLPVGRTRYKELREQWL